MSWRPPTALVFFLMSARPSCGLFHSTDDLSDVGDPAHRFTADRAADPALTLQYRAALLFLHSEGVRRVVQLLRRPPDTSDVTDSLLREAGLRRLGGPLVVGWRADWARLDRWRNQTVDGVAVLVQDEELLDETLATEEAEHWRDAFWYAPESNRDSRMRKARFASEFKVITSRISVSSQTLLFNSNETFSETPIRHFDLGISEVVSRSSQTWKSLRPIDHQWVSGRSRPTAERTSEGVSVVLLRWAPAPASPSPVLQVLRASPWLAAGVYRPGQSTVQPAAALLVQRSVLRSQLRAAGCAIWRVELAAADPLTEEPVRQSYGSDTLPAAVSVQGGGPLALTVYCPALTLHCTLELGRQSCHRDTRRAVRRRRRRRRAIRRGHGPVRPAASREDRARWWERRRIPHHTGRWGLIAPHRSERVIQQPSMGPGWSYPVTRRRRARENRPWWKTPYRVNRAGEDVRSVTYSSKPEDATYPVGYREATRYTYPTDFSYDRSGAAYRDSYPATYGGAAYPRRTQRRQLRIPPDVMLEVSPKFVSCGGAFGGCFLCAVLLELSSSKVPPEACIGPCVVGSGIACSGALATLHKEVVKRRLADARRERSRRGKNKYYLSKGCAVLGPQVGSCS